MLNRITESIQLTEGRMFVSSALPSGADWQSLVRGIRGSSQHKFRVSMQLWRHSGIPVRVFFFSLNPEDVRNIGLWQSGTLLKGQGFHYLISAYWTQRACQRPTRIGTEKVRTYCLLYSIRFKPRIQDLWNGRGTFQNPAILLLLLGTVPSNSHYLTCILIWQHCRKHQRSTRGACGEECMICRH